MGLVLISLYGACVVELPPNLELHNAAYVWYYLYMWLELNPTPKPTTQ